LEHTRFNPKRLQLRYLMGMISSENRPPLFRIMPWLALT